MTQRVTIEIIIGINPGIFDMKTVTVKSFVLEAVEADDNDIHIDIALIE